MFFRAEAGQARQNICLLFAAALDLAIAGLTNELPRWTLSVRDIREFLIHSEAAPLRRHYAECVDALPSVPSADAAEQLLRLVPYF